MHLQAAADLREENKILMSDESGKLAKDRQAQILKNARLADILGAGGLPKIARLDVSLTPPPAS